MLIMKDTLKQGLMAKKNYKPSFISRTEKAQEAYSMELEFVISEI